MRWGWRIVIGSVLTATGALAQSALRLQWTEVWDATEYRVHLRQAATPWGTGTPLMTVTPIWPTTTPGTPVAAWEAQTDPLPAGLYEVAVSACNAVGCSALSNTKVIGAGTPTDTASPAVSATAIATHTMSASATATRTPTPVGVTPTATRTQTALVAPILYRVEWAL